MTATETPTAALDALTNAVTAFETWNEFVASMRGGYCPTIHQTTRRKRLLAKAVNAAGFPYFDGRRVIR